MLRQLILSTLAMCLFHNSSAVSAATHFGTYGGWDVSKLNDGCGLSMEFEGPGATSFTLIKSPDGSSVAGITNYGWSAKDGDKYAVSVELNGRSYSGSATGFRSGVRKGFSIFLPEEFAGDFAKGSTLYVFLGDVLIDELSLKGTAIAMRAVDRCLVRVRSELEAQRKEKERFAHIPKDPFASSNASGPRDPILKRSFEPSYPSRALREELSGAVSITVLVGVRGRVQSCKVTESSGHAILDEASCRHATRYWRFEPALNDRNEPKTGYYSKTITYALTQQESDPTNTPQ